MADDPEDLELRPEEGEGVGRVEDEPYIIPPSRPQGLGPGAWTGVFVGIVVVVGAFWFLRSRPAPPPAPQPVPSAASTPAPTATPPPLMLPPLEGSDAFVRDLAKALSNHPLYALWLGQKDLIRTLAALTLNVADGESPRAHLGFLAPKGTFLVVERRSGRLLIDPASYTRYDAIGDAAATLDPEQCARVYRLVAPLFESAYRELGHPEGGFRAALQTALGKLLEVPVLEGEVPLVRVEKAVVFYEFFDEKIEALGIPQKHLLRMGPRNVARIQEKIRGFAVALGFPATPMPVVKPVEKPSAAPIRP
jgi:hypothetical protein